MSRALHGGCTALAAGAGTLSAAISFASITETRVAGNVLWGRPAGGPPDMEGWDFRKGPWQSVEWLIEETEKFYAENITPKGLGDRFTVAAKKIVELRKWQPALPLIKDNLDTIIRELGIFYVPKQMDPGPCIVFPQKDLTNRYTHGKIKPLYDLVFHDSAVKYANLGDINNIKGPNFFGTTDPVLLAMVETGRAIAVEGFFDTLACRLLAPGAPIVSTGTKSFVESHIYYLQMLGVKQMILMFDNEDPKDEFHTLGAGNQAMLFLSKKFHESGMECSPLESNNNDASLALENYTSAAALKRILEGAISNY